jgi:hypothetical protein
MSPGSIAPEVVAGAAAVVVVSAVLPQAAVTTARAVNKMMSERFMCFVPFVLVKQEEF